MERKHETILDLFKLDGLSAIVTGSRTGIGKALATALAEAGADLLINSRSKEGLEATAEELRKPGRKIVTGIGDVGSKEVRGALIKKALDSFGKIDILVNNAGTTSRGPALETPEDEWNRVLGVNLTGVFYMCQSAAKIMKEQGKGKIINIASMLSFTGGINVISYTASKGGVAQLTKGLANEWAKYHINVNAIAPGYIKTDLTSALLKDTNRYNSIKSRIPAGDWAEPDDLKGAVVFLASRASDYMHGTILPVDGGYLGW